MTHRFRPFDRFLPCCAVLMAFLVASPVWADDLPVSPALNPVDQAITAIRDKDFQRARLAIRLVKDPFQRNALLFRLYRRGGNDATVEEIIGFIEKQPTWPMQASLRQRAEGAHLGRTTDERITDWFSKNPPSTRLGCSRHIDRLIKRGDGPAADDEIVRCWKTVALSADGEAKFLKQYGDKLSDRDKAARVAKLLDRRRHPRAKQLLNLLDLSARRADPLEVRIALQKRPRKAEIAMVLKAIRKLPAKARKDPAYLLDLVRWQRRRRNMAAALRVLAAAPRPVKEARHRWWQERTIAIRRFLETGNMALAYRTTADHRQPPGYLFASAENLAGWIALRKRRQAKQARRHFKTVFDNATRSDVRAQAAYWLARTAAARRDNAKTAAWLKTAAANTTNLFGQLALMDLKAPLLRLPAETVIPADDQTAFNAEPAVKLADFFGENGDTAESRRLLRWLMRQTIRQRTRASSDESNDKSERPASMPAGKIGQRLLMIAERAEALGAPDIALRAARIAQRYGAIRLAIAFPAPTLPAGLPVERSFVLAVTRQESEFNVNAQSSAGAQGLMQLLPTTAKLMARRAKIDWVPDRLKGDAAYNYRLGAAYLDYLLSRFDQSYLLAAAAYNAGPTRVRRWIRQFGHPGKRTNPVDWIESIPFGETRNYVRRVLANVLVYRARLGGGKLHALPNQSWRRPSDPEACEVAGNCKKTTK